MNKPTPPAAASCTSEYDELRPALIRQLRASPERDLVLVKHVLQNPVGYDLVHNKPDIGKLEVVWAHRLCAEKDSRLLRYFADRRVWEFEWLAPDSRERHESKAGQASRPVCRFTALSP